MGVVDHARYRPPVDTYACGYIPGTMPAAWPPPWLWIDTGVTRQLPRGPWQRGAREIIRAEVVPSQARIRPDHQDGSQARQGTACARPIRPTPLAKRVVLCTAPCSTPAGWRPSNTAKCGPFPSSALIPPPASPPHKKTRVRCIAGVTPYERVKPPVAEEVDETTQKRSFFIRVGVAMLGVVVGLA